MEEMDKKEFFVSNVVANQSEFEKHIRSKVYTSDVVEDILQEAYERLWAQMLKPDFDKEPRAWMHGIIKNCIREYWRKAAKGKRVISNIILTAEGEIDLFDTIAAGDDMFERIVTNFETDLACETLLKLKEDYRVLIHMYYIEELTIKEMVEITEMKEKTLRSKLARAVKKYEKVYFAAESKKEKQE